MSAKTHLKANFAVQSKYEAFYTGGKVQLSSDGRSMLCQCGNRVPVVDVSTGSVVCTLGKEDDDEVTSFVLSPDDKVLVVASRGLLLKQWSWEDKTVTRTWKAIHTGPVSCMSFDRASTLLATGGADSTIKVWDVVQQFCTHNLRGHQGVVSVAEFHPDGSRLQLVTGADDYKLRVWDLRKSTCIAVLISHFSVITSLQFDPLGCTLYSGGRDSVVTVWDLDTFTKKKTIPVYEPVEALVLLSSDQDHTEFQVTDDAPHVVTGGSKGVLKVWNTVTAQCVHTHSPHMTAGGATATEAHQAIVDGFYNKALDSIAVVTFDHNIIFYNSGDLSVKKQFAGFNDDVLDIKFLGACDSHLAVATNSPQIKVFELATWSCQILYGHSDIVLCLDVDKLGSLLVSSSKDNSIRVWSMDCANNVQCVAIAHGHTHEVNTVGLAKLSPAFLVSGSLDLTVKVWPLPPKFELDDAPASLQARVTERAHDKDINSITVSPNDKLLATGSLDRTAKLWSASSLALLGVFRGHKRGVWCVQFSPVDQCLVTASADTTVKIWSLSDFTCVKTFEGHESLVLKVHIISRGMQLLTSGSDGLVKLWTVKTNECVKTLDQHEDKVWALAVNKAEDTVLTGAADSRIILWKDVTEEEQEEARVQQHDFILKEQELMNLLQQKKYVKAIGLAVTLDQPYRLLNIFKAILSEPGGEEKVRTTMSQLRPDQIGSVLQYAVKWNTNSRHCHVAQLVVCTVVRLYTPDELTKLPGTKAAIEGLLSYSERHLQRMNRLLQQSMFVDYTWQSMRLVAGDKMAPAAPVSSEMVDQNLWMVEDRVGQSSSASAEGQTGEAMEHHSHDEPPKKHKKNRRLDAGGQAEGLGLIASIKTKSAGRKSISKARSRRTENQDSDSGGSESGSEVEESSRSYSENASRSNSDNIVSLDNDGSDSDDVDESSSEDHPKTGSEDGVKHSTQRKKSISTPIAHASPSDSSSSGIDLFGHGSGSPARSPRRLPARTTRAAMGSGAKTAGQSGAKQGSDKENSTGSPQARSSTKEAIKTPSGRQKTPRGHISKLKNKTDAKCLDTPPTRRRNGATSKTPATEPVKRTKTSAKDSAQRPSKKRRQSAIK